MAQRTAIAGVSAARPRAISSRGDLGEGGQAHEDHQRLGVADLGPIDAVDLVAGDEGDHRGVLAMRERHAGVGRDAQRRGDAGHDLERNAGVGQRFGLFAAAAEDERIAALRAAPR